MALSFPCQSGDVTADGQLTVADVEPFADALIAGAATPELLCAADTNADGLLDGRDVPGFVDAFIGP